MDGEGVIFIGGSMRSGTTLLHRMLCASPDTHRFTDECQHLTALLDFHAHWRGRFDWLKDFFGTPERYDAHAKSTVDGVFQAVLETHRPARAIVLKHPELTIHFPTLADWYAAARFVVILRDPRDTIASILDVGSRHRQAGVDSNLSRMGRDMLRLSRFYKTYYAEALQAPQCRNRISVIRYEDLVARPEQAMAALAEHLGIELNSGLLPPDSFDRRRRDDYVAAFWTGLRAEAPSPASVGRFRRSLSGEEIAAIELHCADFNRVFPYW